MIIQYLFIKIQPYTKARDQATLNTFNIFIVKYIDHKKHN